MALAMVEMWWTTILVACIKLHRYTNCVRRRVSKHVDMRIMWVRNAFPVWSNEASTRVYAHSVNLLWTCTNYLYFLCVFVAAMQYHCVWWTGSKKWQENVQNIFSLSLCAQRIPSICDCKFLLTVLYVQNVSWFSFGLYVCFSDALLDSGDSKTLICRLRRQENEVLYLAMVVIELSVAEMKVCLSLALSLINAPDFFQVVLMYIGGSQALVISSAL